jgi:hypothetical protein
MGGVQGKAMGGVGALQRSWKVWLQKNWDVLPNTPAAWTNISGKTYCLAKCIRIILKL